VAKAQSKGNTSGGGRARSATPAAPATDEQAQKAAEELEKANAANQAPEQADTQAEGLAGAPTEISDAADVDLSEPINRATGRVDVHAGVKGAQEAAAAQREASIAEGEGPVVGVRNKVAAPATVGVPGEEVDVRRHVPRTAPPAPTRFDGRDNPGTR
jgi:hypothetical protein